MRRIALALLAASMIVTVVAAPVAARRGPNLVETAIAVNSSGPYAGAFDTLISLVVAYDLVDDLSRNRQLTVFAPTDAAFDELFAVVDPATLTEEQVLDILLYHIAPGRRDAASVIESSRIPTLNGSRLTVTVNSDGAFVDDSQIIVTDVAASNGIIHAIDTVLLP